MIATWTADEDESLVQMAEAGIPFSKIGAILGRTKNACVGRYHRIRYLYEERPIRNAWRLTMCNELPLGDGPYAPLN